MRRVLLIAGLLTASVADGGIQAQRTVDRLGYSIAPQVRVWFMDGSLAQLGYPMTVQFRTDDDAYVVVGRVDSDGRLSILYPYNRSQRAFARGNVTTTVRDPRLHSDASFYVTDRLRGYVFAIASYVPMDLSAFESRDFQRIGGYSQFTQVNRTVAREPDEYVSRVAAELFWGTDADYDYDVAYYAPVAGATMYMASALSVCGQSYFRRLSYRYSWYSYDDYLMSPYYWACRDLMLGLQCMSIYSFFVPGYCGYYPYRERMIAELPVTPAPRDSVKPNEGIIRSGLWRPDTVSGVPDRRDVDEAERISAAISRLGGKDKPSEFEGIRSIPARAKQKLTRETVAGVEIIRGGKSGTSNAGGVREARRADGSPAVLSKEPKPARGAEGAPTRVAAPMRTAPVTYEPISALKSPKRYTGGSSYGGASPYPSSRSGATSSSSPKSSAGNASSPSARPASSSPSSGNIGQAANTSGKSKEKPPK